MKRLLPALVTALLVCSGLQAQNLKKVVFTPQWTPQSQFAGFYVAKEKGFFAQEGLDVEIKHIGQNANESAMSLLLSGKAQFAGQQLLQSIIARSDGSKIVNVMQTTQQTGLCCVSRHPLSSILDLDNLKVGRWRQGFSEICEILEARSGISINWIPFISEVNLMVFGAVDATLCYSYSELVSLILAMGEIPETNIMRFANFSPYSPEDGIYVTEQYYSRNKDVVDAFVRAAKKGWEYAYNNVEEALDITEKYIKAGNVVTNRVHQRMMLEEYFKLQVNPQTEEADFAPVSEEVFGQYLESLLSTGLIVKSVDYKDLIR